MARSASRHFPQCVPLKLSSGRGSAQPAQGFSRATNDNLQFAQRSTLPPLDRWQAMQVPGISHNCAFFAQLETLLIKLVDISGCPTTISREGNDTPPY